METLKELLRQIVETEKLANIDTEAWDWRTRSSITNTVNEAKDRLVPLRKQYFDRIAEMTIGIFVIGDEAEAFAKIAADEGGTLTVHADALYSRIADLIEPVLADSREFGIMAFSKLTQGITDVGHELNVKAMDLPKYKDGRVLTRKDLVERVRGTIRDTFGDDLNRLYIAAEIQKQAYATRFSATALPVVLIGLECADEARGLESCVAKFGSNVFTKGSTVDREYVFKVFATVKEKFKTKKTTP
jgi:hypothetical protein